MIDPYKKITTDTECLKKRCLCTPVIVGPTARCNKSSIYFFKW